jgi:hypothetical protein
VDAKLNKDTIKDFPLSINITCNNNPTYSFPLSAEQWRAEPLEKQGIKESLNLIEKYF